jgi:hypothetical protein
MSSSGVSTGTANLIFVGVLLVAVVSIVLSGPSVPDNRQRASCVTNFHLPVGGVSINCDSPEFLRLATNPQYLFEPMNVRQARPGHIFAAWLVSRPILPLASVAGRMRLDALQRQRVPPRFDQPLTAYLPAYLAYVLLDIFFLWLTARLFWGILSGPDGRMPWTHFIISLFFVFNGIVYYYFWSPHVQVFNIFVPVFCLWVANKAYQDGQYWQRGRYVLSFLAGLGVVAYTTFCLSFPAILAGDLLRERRITRGLLFRWFANLCLICLPLATWFAIVLLKKGTIYNHEMACCGYGIWHGANGLTGYVSRFCGAAYQIIGNLLTKNLYIFAGGALSCAYLWREYPSERAVLTLVACVSCVYVVFFSVLTLTPDRVLFAVASVWLVPTAMLVRKTTGRLAILSTVAYLSGWIVWMCRVGIGQR